MPALLLALLLAISVFCLSSPVAAQTQIEKTEPPKQVSTSTPRLPRETVATGAMASIIPGRTRFILTVTQPIAAVVYPVGEPNRVLIDVDGLGFEMQSVPLASRVGLIAGFTHGLIAPGKARIVLDLAEPARVVRADAVASTPGRPAQFIVELEAVDANAFAEALAARQLKPALALDPVVMPDQPLANRKPIIVLDPGHGGIDPGAVAQGGVLEKDVVLAVALKVRDVLVADGRFDVRLTRALDEAVRLDNRVAIARDLQADLFISLHADSIAELQFRTRVRGASVYIRSEVASDQAAALLAEKENAADALAGFEPLPGDDGDAVRDVLFDLMRRETQTFATTFRGQLIGELRGSTGLSRDPARSAAFRVLRQAQTPAVLVELGYMSNADDAKLLQDQAWQQRTASAIAKAVTTYFATRGR